MLTATALMPHPQRTLTSRPLFVTRDPALLSTLAALAGRTNTSHDIAEDPDTARRHWLSASVIVIGADAAHAIAASGLPDRSDLILLTGADLTEDQAWPLALAIGARHIVALPESSEWLADRLDPDPARAARPPVIAVTGALGGVGASVLAAAIAVTAGRSAPTSLVDTDTTGPGIDVLLGWERVEGRRWPAVLRRRRPFDPSRWRDSLPTRAGLAVLSADATLPLTPDALALRAVIETCRWTSTTTVVDVPRHGARALGALAPDLTIVVVPSELRAIAPARGLIDAHGGANGSAAIVVRSTPSGPPAAAVAAAVGGRLLGTIDNDPDIPAILNSGRFARRVEGTSLTAVARTVLAETAGRR